MHQFLIASLEILLRTTPIGDMLHCLLDIVAKMYPKNAIVVSAILRLKLKQQDSGFLRLAVQFLACFKDYSSSGTAQMSSSWSRIHPRTGIAMSLVSRSVQALYASLKSMMLLAVQQQYLTNS